MSHQKGLLLPLWMENTIDLVVNSDRVTLDNRTFMI